jgi:anti-sigma B factor antagonist
LELSLWRICGGAGRWVRSWPSGRAGSEHQRYDVRVELSLATRVVSAHTVLEVGGEVDVYTAPRLRERIVELFDGGIGAVVVDLGRVDFMDSTGLGVLVGAWRKARASGVSFGVVCGKESLLKIFRITALDQVLPLYASIDAATAA